MLKSNVDCSVQFFLFEVLCTLTGGSTYTKPKRLRRGDRVELTCFAQEATDDNKTLLGKNSLMYLHPLYLICSLRQIGLTMNSSYERNFKLLDVINRYSPRWPQKSMLLEAYWSRGAYFRVGLILACIDRISLDSDQCRISYDNVRA